MKQTIESSCEAEATLQVGGPIPWWKHCLDLAFVSLTMIAWLLMMALIALGIKLTSRGPLFFRQERIGYKNKPFTCLEISDHERSTRIPKSIPTT